MLQAMIAGLILHLEPSALQKLLEDNNDHNKQIATRWYPDLQFASQLWERPEGS